jgi:hypothetical protein
MGGSTSPHLLRVSRAGTEALHSPDSYWSPNAQTPWTEVQILTQERTSCQAFPKRTVQSRSVLNLEGSGACQHAVKALLSPVQQALSSCQLYHLTNVPK